MLIGHTVLSLLFPQNSFTNPVLSQTRREIKKDLPLRALPIIEIVLVSRFPVEIMSYSFFCLKYSTMSSAFQIGPADVSANGTGKFASLFLQFDTLLLLVPHKLATSLKASRAFCITILSSFLTQLTITVNIVHISCEFNILHVIGIVKTLNIKNLTKQKKVSNASSGIGCYDFHAPIRSVRISLLCNDICIIFLQHGHLICIVPSVSGITSNNRPFLQQGHDTLRICSPICHPPFL